MKNVNVTFSIPKELNAQLHANIGKRGLSRFVVEAIQKALYEKRQTLRQAYIEARDDPDRIETINDWKVLDDETWD